MRASRRGERRTFWPTLVPRRWWMMLVSTVALNSGLTQSLTKGIPCLALNCHACPLAVTACPVGMIQHFGTLGKVPWYVLGVIGLAGALWGRLACGWLCPFGWLQELVHKLPVPKWPIRPRRRARWPLLLAATVAYATLGWFVAGYARQSLAAFGLYLVGGFVLYAFLGVSRAFALAGVVVVVSLLLQETWFCKLCPAGALQAGLPWVVLEPALQELIGPLFWIKLAILALSLAWMAVTRRPFCRWVCPLGAIWSPLNRWSTLHMAVEGESCIRCDRCQRVCPMDIRIYHDANSPACIRCMECVVACPVSCISVRGR